MTQIRFFTLNFPYLKECDLPTLVNHTPYLEVVNHTPWLKSDMELVSVPFFVGLSAIQSYVMNFSLCTLAYLDKNLSKVPTYSK